MYRLTFFDLLEDDEFDGEFGEDDEETPRALFGFNVSPKEKENEFKITPQHIPTDHETTLGADRMISNVMSTSSLFHNAMPAKNNDNSHDRGDSNYFESGKSAVNSYPAIEGKGGFTPLDSQRLSSVDQDIQLMIGKLCLWMCNLPDRKPRTDSEDRRGGG